MIKLKLNKEKLSVLYDFSSFTCAHIFLELEKFLYKKKTIELLQFRIQLEEMRAFRKKLEILKIKKEDIDREKLFTVSLSPVQSLLILIYHNNFIEATTKTFSAFVVNEQKDIIYKELLTK